MIGYNKKHTAFTQQELNELILKAQQGDIQSRNTVIEHNMGLAMKYARWSYSRGLGDHYEDCVQQAVFGLIRAIELFDTERNFAFSTYATQWVQQAINRYLDQSTYLIRTPIYSLNLQGRYNQIKMMHTDKEEDFYLKMTAFEMNVSIETVLNAIKRKPSYTYVDKKLEDNQEFQLASKIKTLDNDLDHMDITILMKLLQPREKRIIELRIEGFTYQQIGDIEGVSRERIRQLLNATLIKLKGIVKRIRSEG